MPKLLAGTIFGYIVYTGLIGLCIVLNLLKEYVNPEIIWSQPIL